MESETFPLFSSSSKNTGFDKAAKGLSVNPALTREAELLFE